MPCLQGIYRDETLVEMQTLRGRGRRLTLAQDPILARQREKEGKLRKPHLCSRIHRLYLRLNLEQENQENTLSP